MWLDAKRVCTKSPVSRVCPFSISETLKGKRVVIGKRKLRVSRRRGVRAFLWSQVLVRRLSFICWRINESAREGTGRGRDGSSGGRVRCCAQGCSVTTLWMCALWVCWNEMERARGQREESEVLCPVSPPLHSQTHTPRLTGQKNRCAVYVSCWLQVCFFTSSHHTKTRSAKIEKRKKKKKKSRHSRGILHPPLLFVACLFLFLSSFAIPPSVSRLFLSS